MTEELSQHYKYETLARNSGYRFIAGGDEAGRGPWAGPVCAAMVVLSEADRIVGLDDSKKLSRSKRRALFAEITARALSYGVGWASAEEIDRYNILEATRLAFNRAFEQLQPTPDYVLLDYIKLPWLRLPHQAFVKGESVSASVAAASILAKESRDCLMEELALKFPQYGFEKHMGYGTAAHQKALLEFGPCEIHRCSFKPVKNLLPLPTNNENLFTAEYK